MKAFPATGWSKLQRWALKTSGNKGKEGYSVYPFSREICIIFFLACHGDILIWSHGLFYNRVTGHFAVSASVISFLINYPPLFFVLILFWRGFLFSILAGKNGWGPGNVLFVFVVSFSKALLYHILVYNVWFD